MPRTARPVPFAPPAPPPWTVPPTVPQIDQNPPPMTPVLRQAVPAPGRMVDWLCCDTWNSPVSQFMAASLLFRSSNFGNSFDMSECTAAGVDYGRNQNFVVGGVTFKYVQCRAGGTCILLFPYEQVADQMTMLRANLDVVNFIDGTKVNRFSTLWSDAIQNVIMPGIAGYQRIVAIGGGPWSCLIDELYYRVDLSHRVAGHFWKFWPMWWAAEDYKLAHADAKIYAVHNLGDPLQYWPLTYGAVGEYNQTFTNGRPHADGQYTDANTYQAPLGNQYTGLVNHVVDPEADRVRRAALRNREVPELFKTTGSVAAKLEAYFVHTFMMPIYRQLSLSSLRALRTFNEVNAWSKEWTSRVDF